MLNKQHLNGLQPYTIIVKSFVDSDVSIDQISFDVSYYFPNYPSFAYSPSSIDFQFIIDSNYWIDWREHMQQGPSKYFDDTPIQFKLTTNTSNPNYQAWLVINDNVFQKFSQNGTTYSADLYSGILTSSDADDFNLITEQLYNSDHLTIYFGDPTQFDIKPSTIDIIFDVDFTPVFDYFRNNSLQLTENDGISVELFDSETRQVQSFTTQSASIKFATSIPYYYKTPVVEEGSIQPQHFVRFRGALSIGDELFLEGDIPNLVCNVNIIIDGKTPIDAYDGYYYTTSICDFMNHTMVGYIFTPIKQDVVTINVQGSYSINDT